MLSPGEISVVVSRINESIIAEVPHLADDPGLCDALIANTTAQVEAVAAFALGRGDAGTPLAAVRLAQTFARRGLELEQLLRVYRIGLRSGQQYIAASVEVPGAHTSLVAAAAVDLITVAGQWLDRSVEHLAVAHNEEKSRWLADPRSTRAQKVREVLRGEVADAGVASESIGYAVDRSHIALALWGGPGVLTPEALESTARALRRAVDADAELAVSTGDHSGWIWLAGDRVGSADLGRIVAVAVAAVDDTLRAAVGSTARGLAGFVRSHQEAVAAQRIGFRALRDDVVTAYDDVEVVSLLAADAVAMRAFLRRELGALNADDDNAARLRETVLAALEHGNAAAGRLLHIHTNTVRYRVLQAEGLLDHPIAARSTELILALRCADYLGVDE